MLGIIFWITLILLCLWLETPRRPVVSLAKVMEAFDLAKTEAELNRPLAEVIAEAERKAIAIHSPLAGDPALATVVDLTPAPSVILPVAGYTIDNVASRSFRSADIEVTALGDRERSFIPGGGFPVQGIFRGTYNDGVKETLMERHRYLLQQVRDYNRSPRKHTEEEHEYLMLLGAELDQIRRRLSAIRKAQDNARLDP